MTAPRMLCPGCSAPLTTRTLESHLGGVVEIDICAPCQAFWFDNRESLQLTPGSTLELFRFIGERAVAQRQALSPVAKCPRCASRLVVTHDMQRNVRFEYRRCPHGHGRLITFFDFLREKNFIKPLSPAQIQALRRNLRSVNCSNCAAPVDLARESACSHCGSPLSMLDIDQAERLIGQLQQADTIGRPIDPTLPIRLEEARREVETAFAGVDQGPGWFDQLASSDLVTAGLAAVTRWLKRRA